MARKALRPAQQAVVQAVERTLNGPALVACSGGADSMALALGAAVVGRRRDWPVRAVVVDHGLQDGSAAVAQAVVRRLADRGVPAVVVPVLVAPTGDGVEAAARDARYAALTGVARPGEQILLGHTLDDQAETVLLGLARGSGARSLAGMRPERGQFVRPLLGLRAATVRQACREWDIEWWDDPQNDDERFARVRVRKTVLPLLEQQLGPGVAEALARTADLARADADTLDDLAQTALDHLVPQTSTNEPSFGSRGPREVTDGNFVGLLAHQLPDGSLECAALASLPPAVRTRVLRAWLLGAGVGELGAVHVQAVDALVVAWRGQRGADVPGARVTREAGRLWARPAAPIG